MPDYTAFFLASPSSVVQLETLEISHPDFTKVHRVVRNATRGLSATLTEGGPLTAFDYYPLRISRSVTSDSLEQGLRVDLGDLGTVWPLELDAVAAGDSFGTRPEVIYRTYRSDDLSSPLYGPIELEAASLSFNRQGVSFEAQAPRLNTFRTGETYDFTRFPMLRGFL